MVSRGHDALHNGSNPIATARRSHLDGNLMATQRRYTIATKYFQSAKDGCLDMDMIDALGMHQGRSLCGLAKGSGATKHGNQWRQAALGNNGRDMANEPMGTARRRQLMAIALTVGQRQDAAATTGNHRRGDRQSSDCSEGGRRTDGTATGDDQGSGSWRPMVAVGATEPTIRAATGMGR
jgi:hypothetical protein